MDEHEICVDVNYEVEDFYDLQKAVVYKLPPWVPTALSILLLIMAAISIMRKPPLGNTPLLTYLLILFPIFILKIVPSAFKIITMLKKIFLSY